MSNLNMENKFLEELGAYVASSMGKKQLRPYIVTKQAKINSGRNLAKIASYYLSQNSSGEEFNEDVFVLNKIANTKDEDWTSFHDDVVETLCKQANILSGISTATSLGFKGLTPLIGAAPALAAAAIPTTGFVLGGASHIAEHGLNEDELSTEKVKALIVKYNQMAALLEREIANKKLKLMS